MKSKILFNLTRRQLVCFGAAVLIGVPSFFALKRAGNASLATLGMMLIMLPLFLLAMYEKDGQPLEVIAHQFIQAKFLRPKVRPYQTDCYYAALLRQYQVYKEVDAIVGKESSVGAGKPACKPDAQREKAVSGPSRTEPGRGQRSPDGAAVHSF